MKTLIPYQLEQMKFMKYNFKRWLYYRFVRLAIKTKELKIDEKPLTKIQERTMKITMALILDKECLSFPFGTPRRT